MLCSQAKAIFLFEITNYLIEPIFRGETLGTMSFKAKPAMGRIRAHASNKHILMSPLQYLQSGNSLGVIQKRF
jgi:hypothetical protein